MDDTLVPKQEESLMDVSPPLVSSSAKLARKAIRGSDGLWKLVPSPPGPTPSTPTHSQPHANSHAGDVEMRDVSVSTPNGHSYVHIENGGPSSSTPAHGGISLVLKLGGVGAAGGGGGTNGTGMSSRHSSPGLNASGSGNGSTKKKRRIEVPPNPTRASRSAVKPPSPIPTPISLSIEPSPLPTALTQPELPTGPLAIFAPPPPSDFLPDALQDIVGSTLLPPSQAASTSGRIRLTRGRDPGIRSGISASGKGVKVGGVRTTTPVPGKKKGKGKVHEDVPNQDFCSSCRGIGRFLCCDGCPRSFHFMCLEPPLRIDELPEEERWFCKKCRVERESEDSPPPSRDLKPIPMVFSQLNDRLDHENPTQFRLPQEIRQFFSGVGTGPKGDYIDAEETRTKYDRKGYQEERDSHRLKDGKSRPVACYVCAGTSIPVRQSIADPEASWRQIVSCDYCALHWHLDCLDPPLATMPNSGRRWMCPNHAEMVMPRRRTVRNGLETVDVETRGQRNNGNIVILPDEEAKAQMEYEDMVINSKKYRVPERIIRLDFWEKLGLGKGRTVAPAKTAASPPLSIEDVEAANLILGLLHPSVAPSPPDPEAELRTPSHQASTPSTPETATRKIMLRMTRPSGLAHSPTTANMAPPETPLSGVFKEDLVETD